MCLFKRERSLSLFPYSLFLVFLLFSSANLFKLLSPFLLSPSLISKPQSLYAAGAQLCVCDCVCVCIHVCVCLCGFFWHSAATVSIAHCTQRTRAAKKRGKKRKRENRGKTLEWEGLTCMYCTEWRGRAFWTGPTITADESALWDEGWRERDSNEEPRHHSLLPGLFKGLSSGVRTSGWEGQRRKKKRGGWQRWGADGVDRAGDSENSSSGVRRQDMEGLRGVRGRDRRDGTGDRMWDNLSVSSFVPQCSHRSKCHRFLPS